ncbi:MAG: hypothetical protein M3Y51_05785 [Actinomycetota bacterium]|nr:hypothetical protein [Actinomycetota bacterium]
MHRSSRPARGILTACCLAGVALLAAAMAVSCSNGVERGTAVEPVERLTGEDGAGGSRPTAPVDGPGDAPATRSGAALPDVGLSDAAPPDDGPSVDEQPPGPTDDDEVRALVQSVLDRYDAALTTVAADPLAAVPGHPSLDEWHGVVIGSGSFSVSMLGDMADRATSESTVVRPGAGGRSYRHHAVRAVADGTAVSFTWCGHAPGSGIDTATGAVVDDAVAISSGTGELRHDGAVWRILTLDAFDLEVTAPGTDDPCPAQVAAVARASR